MIRQHWQKENSSSVPFPPQHPQHQQWPQEQQQWAFEGQHQEPPSEASAYSVVDQLFQNLPDQDKSMEIGSLVSMLREGQPPPQAMEIQIPSEETTFSSNFSVVQEEPSPIQLSPYSPAVQPAPLIYGFPQPTPALSSPPMNDGMLFETKEEGPATSFRESSERSAALRLISEMKAEDVHRLLKTHPMSNNVSPSSLRPAKGCSKGAPRVGVATKLSPGGSVLVTPKIEEPGFPEQSAPPSSIKIAYRHKPSSASRRSAADKSPSLLTPPAGVPANHSPAYSGLADDRWLDWKGITYIWILWWTHLYRSYYTGHQSVYI